MANLIILIVFEVLLFFGAFYVSNRDIMAPSCMMCIMFIISTTFALLNIENWNEEFSVDTVLLIVIGLIVFIIAEVMFRFFFCGQLRGKTIVCEEDNDEPVMIKSWILSIIIIFDVIIICLYLRSIIKTVGGSMMSISSYFHAYRVMGIRSMNSSGTSITSGFINFALRFVSGTGYMAGYMLMYNLVVKGARMGNQSKYLIITILCILRSMMSGGRSGILKMLSALLIYYYICWHQKHGWTKNLSWKYIRIGIIAFFIMAPVFYFSLGLLGRQTNLTFTDYVSGYLAGSIFLLDKYIKAPTKCTSWGEESLVGVRKLLAAIGIEDASTKYNLEFRSLGIGRSNVYTFFRRPLHDFGFVGMCVFVALISFFFAWIYYRKIKYQPRFKCSGWTIAYGYLYYWIICSPIDQYSVNMISAGALIQILIAVGAYKIFTQRSDVVNIKKEKSNK